MGGQGFTSTWALMEVGRALIFVDEVLLGWAESILSVWVILGMGRVY